LNRTLQDAIKGIQRREIAMRPPKYTLGAHAIIPYFTIYVHERDGELVTAYTKGSRSFNVNFGSYVQMLCNGMTASSITDTGGTGRTPTLQSSTANILDMAGGAAQNNYGLVFGTGTNAEAVTDTKLQTIIAHGVGAGQLSYGACAVGAATTSGTDTSFTVTRSCTNSSGGTITTQELGIYIRGNITATPWYFGVIRDLNTQAVNNTQVITGVYTLSFPV
jgi:hypothetical protein